MEKYTDYIIDTAKKLLAIPSPTGFTHMAANFVKKELEGMGYTPEITQYNFCTNGSHYAGEAGIKTFGLGPSKENLAHTVNEYIEIDQLTKVTDCYYGVMKALLK